jgi:hypothetical protein
LGCLSVIHLPQSFACQRSLVEVRPAIPVCILVGSVGLCVRAGLCGAPDPWRSAAAIRILRGSMVVQTSLVPSRKYAHRTVRFPVNNPAIFKLTHFRPAQAEEGPMIVFVYVNTASRFCAALKVTASSQREAAFAITRCLDLYPWPDGSGTHHAIRAFTASTSSLVFPGQTASAQPCAARSGPTRDAPKVSASGSGLGDQQMRVLVILSSRTVAGQLSGRAYQAGHEYTPGTTHQAQHCWLMLTGWDAATLAGITKALDCSRS